MFIRCNEELDDKVVIKRLKQRVAELEAQVQGFKNGNLQQVCVLWALIIVSLVWSLDETTTSKCGINEIHTGSISKN